MVILHRAFGQNTKDEKFLPKRYFKQIGIFIKHILLLKVLALLDLDIRS